MPSRVAAVLAVACVAVACGNNHAGSPALKHAKAACASWARLNVGIADATNRQQESDVFTREATAAAAADGKYKPLQTAAESWTLAQASPTSADSIGALRSAIDQSRAACAGVPTN